MLREIVTGLLPRISIEMANHPAVPHSIARCRDLRMHVSAGELGPAVMRDLECVVADEASAEALLMIKLVGVDLRLRMIVRYVS